MSDVFGGEIPSADWHSYLDQAQGLYNEAQGGLHPSAAAYQQVGQLKSQMLPQAYRSGLTGSTLTDEALSRGATEAINKDILGQTGQELGLMGQIGEADVARQAAEAEQSAGAFGLLGKIAGMGLGAYFGGPMGAMLGGQAMGTMGQLFG